MNYEYDALGHSETDVIEGVIKLKVVGRVYSTADELEYLIKIIRPVKVEGLELCRGIMEPDWYDVREHVAEMRSIVISKIIEMFPSATPYIHSHLKQEAG